MGRHRGNHLQLVLGTHTGNSMISPVTLLTVTSTVLHTVVCQDILLPAGMEEVLSSSYVETGEVTYQRWSFFCGNGTVFDQQSLVCNHPEDAFPCEESPSLYGLVEFGKVEEDY